MRPIKEKAKKALWFFANPHLLLCVALAWMITNGWSYILLGVGTLWGIEWMTVVAGGYLTFLWIPMTPEKILTCLIAIFLLKKLFPKDEKTLLVLTNLYNDTKAMWRARREKRRQKKTKRNE